MIKTIINSFKKKNPIFMYNNKNVFKMPDKVSENIYGCKTMGEHIKKHHWIHYVFKYKFLVPILIIAQAIIGKLLKNMEIPNTKYNELYVLSKKAWDSTMDIWTEKYIKNQDCRKNNPMTKKQIKAWRKSLSFKTLNFIYESGVAMSFYDTAYRPVFEIYHLEFTRLFNSKYKNIKKYNHLIYTSGSPFDATYFNIIKEWKNVEEN